MVIATSPPGRFDAHGRRSTRPALDVAPLFFDPARPRAGENLATLLEASGLFLPLRLATPEGKWPDDVTMTRLARASDGGEIIALQRDTSAKPPIVVTLTLPRARRVEDLRENRLLGLRREITLTLDPVLPTILALSD